MKKVAVIGAGPSGMMASYCASKNNKVTLFEKNEKIGKKLFITGKGRCNITNSKEISEFFNDVVRNNKFLYSSLYSMNNVDTLKLFNMFGLETKIERGDRVFPKSDKSSDVIKTYEKMLEKNSVEIRLNSEVKNIRKVNGQFIVNLGNKSEYFDSVIIATGGISYKATGSTGDGYKFAKDFDIKVEKLYPALVPINLKDKFIEDLQGLTLKNISLKVKKNKKIVHEEFGELLFSHFGITGPVVLRTSSYINRNSNFKLYIDLKPALDNETLDSRILRDFDKYKNKELKNALVDLLPKSLIPIIINISGIRDKKEVNTITKEERFSLLNTIKNMPLEFDSFLDINYGIVTSGGISVKEINPSTMESKKIKDLYFCGEVLDVDALTGGFNLQIANSTGYLAGNSIT